MAAKRSQKTSQLRSWSNEEELTKSAIFVGKPSLS